MACKYIFNNKAYSEEEFKSFVQNNFLGDKKIRRNLETQSDLFQKGRDKKDLAGRDTGFDPAFYRENFDSIEEMKEYQRTALMNENNSTENQFLQLLNKDNNWVTFFIKSIIQDSFKKGYEKVLFPSGNTASKIEGHSTLEEFKKQKEDRIAELEKSKTKQEYKQSSVYRKGDAKILKVSSGNGNLKDGFAIWKDDLEELIDKNSLTGEEGENATGVKFLYIKDSIAKSIFEEDANREIFQLKQELERVEKEGFGALKPIYNFYENTVTNILNNLYKNRVARITDEYGNTWNEVSLYESNNYSNPLVIDRSVVIDNNAKQSLLQPSELRQEMFNNWRDYYEGYDDLSDEEKIQFIELVESGLLEIQCKI